MVRTTIACARCRYASYVRENIQIIDGPDIYTAQTLVVMSVYEWSTANAYRGWMFSGMAARMMHSILVLVKPGQLTAIEREVHSRSIWSCYVLDRLIFCGRSVPFDLAAYGLQRLQIDWPIGEQDFAFAQQSSDHRHANDEREHLLEGMKGDIDHYYDVLVRGFDIWARILNWVLAGGRRLPGMSDPENCPWLKTSAWGMMYDEISRWREAQDVRLRYPETGVEGHAVLGQAEAFAYVNLIYYICDPPFLPSEAPPGYWNDIVGQMSDSAVQIVKLLEDLEQADASLLTPFAGYCSFSAATINIYINCYPRYNLGRSPDSAATLAVNMAFLDRLRKVLPMGEGWWTTIWHCQTLYQRASQNHNSFRGKTRFDFIALEKSMQDCGANPPTETDYLLQTADKPTADPTPDHVTEAAISLQELSGSHAPASQDILSPGGPWTNEWNQMWPLWGENQHVPFALEGIPFDYNMNILDA
ncbi:putative fungal specific transcription protein [Phaeoacremonium minimum UCRPA7]|uniref:Putative fungal specific transcription protein n=1 Tax=Phaeoacremonium minimum (strain UCR-PA7) TaxID=1286976 RepID=R8B9P9_PHAM7|nr:putative fungal specific transcription protein [Phaeoacremonium minimum UCRPA7]EON96023.1 putative fungal specific transcription protein [Phaeoacremonium minimum UCRPA7]